MLEKGIIIAHSLTQPAHQSGVRLCVRLCVALSTLPQPPADALRAFYGARADGQEAGRTKAFVDPRFLSIMDPGGDDLTHQQLGERWGQGHSKQDVTLEYAINTKMPSQLTVVVCSTLLLIAMGLPHTHTHMGLPHTHTHTGRLGVGCRDKH